MDDLLKQGDQAAVQTTPPEVQAEEQHTEQVPAESFVSESQEQFEQTEVVAEAAAEPVAPEIEKSDEVVEAPVQTEAVPETSEPVSKDFDLAVPEAKGEPKWYIVQTLTGQEDRVKSRIETTVEEMGLKDRILRVLVPEEETVEIRGDKRVERKRKMYPGYVFVEMILDEDTWYKIRSTAGVARFIGGKTSPVAVTDREMQRVLKQLGIKEKEITVEFSVGEPIRIISGSFRGYTGSVSEISPTKSKLKAMINIFGRDTSVEVDFDRIEKVI